MFVDAEYGESFEICLGIKLLPLSLDLQVLQQLQGLVSGWELLQAKVHTIQQNDRNETILQPNRSTLILKGSVGEFKGHSVNKN